MSGSFIFNFTPTGMVPTTELTPHVPIRPSEIVEQVLMAVDCGVNMVHLHARDPETEAPTYRMDPYAEIISGIRHVHRELAICVTTSGRTFREFEQRAECLDLEGTAKPDLASLTLSSLNFAHGASMNSPEMIQALATRMKERGIKPELEVFDLGMMNYARYLARKGYIEPPYYFNFILGNVASAQIDPLALGMLVRELPADSTWAVGGIGPGQLNANVMGLACGGGVRVGLEDNLYMDSDRKILASNQDLLKRVRDAADLLGKRPYTLSEARSALGIGPAANE